MALVDFECTKCGDKFFEIVKPDEADKVKCPKCGGEVRRVYKGKYYGKSGGSCSGSCSGCSGCSH
jgi:putative FmdB family regulatory protein